MMIKLMARIAARIISGILIFLGTTGLFVVKDVFSNHATLIILSLWCLLVGGLIWWWSRPFAG